MVGGGGVRFKHSQGTKKKKEILLMNCDNSRNLELFYPIHSDKNYILNSFANQLMIAGNNYTFNFT